MATLALACGAQDVARTHATGEMHAWSKDGIGRQLLTPKAKVYDLRSEPSSADTARKADPVYNIDPATHRLPTTARATGNR